MALTYGSKKRKQHWAECRTDDRLKKSNVAVILGDKYRHPTRGTEIECHGVCSFDFDGNAEAGIAAESVAEQFFAHNPHFKWSFRTGAKRGFNVWFRVEGDAPTSFNLYSENGKKVGEFRATGNYTVVAGKHPDGPNYRTIVDLPAITITDISTVKWIDGKPLCKKGTQAYTETYNKPLSPLSGALSLLSPLVASHLPTAPHQTDNLHFELAGEIRGSGYSLTDSEVVGVGRMWWKLANKQFLRPEVSRDQYAAEFLNRYKRRRYAKGLGSVAFEQALERAQQLDAPHLVVECFPHDTRVQFIGLLCRELARGSSNKRFFLSTRKIQELLESGTPKLGSKILKDLEAVGLIACVNRPPRGVRKANEFLYLLDDFDLEVIP